MTTTPSYMPAAPRTRQRKMGQYHSDVARQRIRAGVILDRFHKHFMGEMDLKGLK